MSDSPVSPEDIHAAAETYRELGPEYHDAVVASFVQKIDREVEARVEARLAEMAAAQPPQRRQRLATLTKRRRVRDMAVAGAAALAVVGVAAVVGVQHSSSAGGQVKIARPVPAGRHEVIPGPNGKRIVIPQAKIPQPPAPPAPPKG
jgi:negative regulator of sigma E activity